MARHPNVLTKINYVTTFLADMCDVPYTVYIETLWPALLKLFLSYYALDLMQILTSFARPSKALARSRRGPHGSGRKNRGRPKTFLGKWGRWLSYDPWDHVGRKWGQMTELPGREVTGGVIHFWRLFDILQRIAYWWMVIDLVTTFFYDWFSAVNASYYCQRQRNAWLSAHGDGNGANGLLDFWPTPCEYIDKIRGPITWNIVAGSYLGGSAAFGFSAGLTPTIPPAANFIQLVILNLVTGERHVGDWDPAHPTDRVSVAFKIVPGVGYAVGTNGDGNYFVSDPSVFMVGLDEIP